MDDAGAAAGAAALAGKGEAWRKWVLDNLQRGCAPADLLQRMLGSGWRAAEAGAALEAACRMLGLSSDWRRARPDIDCRSNFVDCTDRQVRILLHLEAPRIVLLEDLLSSAECDALVAEAEARGLRASAVVDRDSGKSVQHDARTSDGTYFSRAQTPLVASLELRLSRLTGWPQTHAEGLQVLRYGEGQEYRPHFDWFNPDNPGSARHLAQGGQRVGTTVIYLTDTEAGGGTVFPGLGLEVHPRKGGAVFFADVDPAGHVDRQTLHGGLPVIRGTKIIATCWQREGAFGSGS